MFQASKYVSVKKMTNIRYDDEDDEDDENDEDDEDDEDDKDNEDDEDDEDMANESFVDLKTV